MGDDTAPLAPMPAPRRSSRRATAGTMALAWSTVLLVIGVLILVVLPSLVRAGERGYCENIDHPGPCSGAEVFVPGLVVVSGASWCLVATIGFRRGRPWAGPAVVLTFALLAAGALSGAVAAAVSSDPPQPGTVLIYLALTAYLATIATLASGRAGRA